VKKDLEKYTILLILKILQMSTLPKLKIKQFYSKYPFSKAPRLEKIKYEGHVNDCPEPLFSEIEDELEENTKFIIVYENE
jgi:hypothetical protein